MLGRQFWKIIRFCYEFWNLELKTFFCSNFEWSMKLKNSFSCFIRIWRKKAEMSLSFVRRQCRDELSTDIAILLYNALVRSQLEFASLIWNPHCNNPKLTIESVQKQGVIFFHHDYINRSDNGYVLAPYVNRCE